MPRPPKPVLIFDGDCNFCRRWICRWQQITGDRVEYVPFQDPSVAERFPNLTRQDFERSVQFIDSDGRFFSGAEAVFRSLAVAPHKRWMLWLYQRVPGVAPVTECFYRFVARHRTAFSFLTRLGWGKHVEVPTHFLTRWVFLRVLGLIYLIAFVSLWMQLDGLIGSHGITPAASFMELVRRWAQEHTSWQAFQLAPTLCWFSTSDAFLHALCWGGALLSLLVVCGVAPAVTLFGCWLLYLSLSVVSDVFLGFQWDALLLETGFLAIFFAPRQLRPRLSRETPPSRTGVWLLRWLLFRLMFASGVVKLSSGDPTWHDLTALTFHYETQPLPTWIGWYAHQLPAGFQRTSCAIMFAIELAVPYLIFAPRRLRLVACWTFITFMALISVTGNYCFFNLLTVALCLLLLDDAALRRFAPARWRDVPARPHSWRWPWWITGPAAVAVVLVTTMTLVGAFRTRVAWPAPLVRLHGVLAPLRSFNGYGLFAVMTTSRPEIIVEGSDDGLEWTAYEFKYKPGDLARRPQSVAPHQPRLDWQMWFAALGSHQHNPWFLNFCTRLLQGQPEVLRLVNTNPFPNAPPRYIRAMAYDYRFTDFVMRRATGQWWRRELKGPYCPILSLRQ